MATTFNPNQFKEPPKKKEVDPNAPPRPNLMSHDKVIREQKDIIMMLERNQREQGEEISRLKSKYADMQQSINQLVNYLRKGQ